MASPGPEVIEILSTRPAQFTTRLGSRDVRSASASIKRPRSPAPPITATTTTTPSLVAEESAAKRARGFFFDLLVRSGEPAESNGAGAAIRTIACPDDLEGAELRLCFDILHACGKATQQDASLATTRKSIEGFLTAIFNEFHGGQERELDRPELNLSADARVTVGRVCGMKDEHATIQDCTNSLLCRTTIHATAHISSCPTTMKLDFTECKPQQLASVAGAGAVAVATPIDVLGRDDIRWAEAKWRSELRTELRDKISAKVHRHNKYLALWYARGIIRRWARGEASGSNMVMVLPPSADGDGEKAAKRPDWAFVGMDMVDKVLVLLGEN